MLCPSAVISSCSTPRAARLSPHSQPQPPFVRDSGSAVQTEDRADRTEQTQLPDNTWPQRGLSVRRFIRDGRPGVGARHHLVLVHEGAVWHLNDATPKPSRPVENAQLHRKIFSKAFSTDGVCSASGFQRPSALPTCRSVLRTSCSSPRGRRHVDGNSEEFLYLITKRAHRVKKRVHRADPTWSATDRHTDARTRILLLFVSSCVPRGVCAAPTVFRAARPQAEHPWLWRASNRASPSRERSGLLGRGPAPAAAWSGPERGCPGQAHVQFPVTKTRSDAPRTGWRDEDNRGAV